MPTPQRPHAYYFKCFECNIALSSDQTNEKGEVECPGCHLVFKPPPPHEVDPALFAMSVLSYLAGYEPMPQYIDFGLTDEQFLGVMEVIDAAIANCGGISPDSAPLTDVDR